MAEVTFKIEKIVCTSCVARIETNLKKLDGVFDVEVLLMTSSVKIKYDEDLIKSSALKSQIEKLGHDVLEQL